MERLVRDCHIARGEDLAPGGVLEQAMHNNIDRVYARVFESVAFQTEVACTFTEAVEQSSR
ncbi:MAG: hypothetical protein JF606_04030 [Burkholderiales bacterium]|nr:hypothetical protein [Burkholderiales bacterium]